MSAQKLEVLGPFTCGGGHVCRITYEPHDGDPVNVVEHPHCEKAGSRSVPGVPVEWQEKKSGAWVRV